MKKNISLAFFTLGVLFFGSDVSAQSIPSNTSTSSKAISATVATVNIYNARIVSQRENTLRLSFDLSNREGVQSGIKYSVVLTKPPFGSTADEKVYDEIIELGPNQTIQKNIIYTSPVALSGGIYQLWIKSNNDRGLPLALASLGDVTLQSNKLPRIEIISDTCSLSVKGEKPQKGYKPNQGVDINQNEVLIANCKIFSDFTILKPVFETYNRTIYGNKVNQTEPVVTAVTVKAGTSTLSFELPKALQPQSYDLLFSLTSSTTTSNTARFHYVLRGASGTIQNIVFDKSSYKTGDTAKLQIFLTPSADTFPDSRLGAGTSLENQVIKVTVTNREGVVCGQQMMGVNNLVINALVPIVTGCNDPKANISFEAKSGGKSQILDTKEAKVTTPVEVKASWPVAETITIIVGFILIMIVIMLRVHINKKLKSIFVLFLVFGLYMFGGVDMVKADTKIYNVAGYTYVYNLGLNKSTYDFGESIIASGSVSDVSGGCNFNSNTALSISADVDGGPQESVVQAVYSCVGNLIFYDTYGVTAGSHILNGQDWGNTFDYVDGVGWQWLPHQFGTHAIPFDVNTPALTASLVASPSSGSATLDNTLTATRTGGTAIGAITYQFKCKDIDMWSLSQSSNSFSCTYTTNGTYTASAKVTQSGIIATPVTVITVGSSQASPPPTGTPTVDLSANPLSVTYNSSSQLSWVSENTTSCVTGASWPASYTGTSNYVGVSTGPITATKTYEITCTGPEGSASDSVTVTLVNSPPNGNVIITATPSSVNTGNYTNLFWSTSQNPDKCFAGDNWPAPYTKGTEVPLVNTTGLQTSILNVTTTFDMTCTWTVPWPSSDRAFVTVTANPPPTVEMTVNPSYVLKGQGTFFFGSSQNTTSCDRYFIPTGTMSPYNYDNTIFAGTGAMYTDSSFSVTCIGPGGTANASTDVHIAIPSLSATPSTGEVGGMTNVKLTASSWGVNNMYYAFKCHNTDPVWSVSSLSNIYYCNYPTAGDYIADVAIRQTTQITGYPQSDTYWSTTEYATTSVKVTAPVTSLPDLTAVMLTSSGGAKDSLIYFYANISNIGGVSVDSSFRNFFQVAEQTSGGGTVADVIPMVAISPDGLGSGENAPILGRYTFTSDGVKSVKVCADSQDFSFAGTVTESDETNNCSSWQDVRISTPVVEPVLNLWIGSNGSTADSSKRTEYTVKKGYSFGLAWQNTLPAWSPTNTEGYNCSRSISNDPDGWGSVLTDDNVDANSNVSSMNTSVRGTYLFKITCTSGGDQVTYPEKTATAILNVFSSFGGEAETTF